MYCQSIQLSVVVSALIMLLLMQCAAEAANKTYIGGGGSLSWSTGGNWSPFGAPGQDDNVFITPSDSLNRSISYIGSGSLLQTYGAITLGSTGSGVAQLFNTADLEALSLNVGTNSSYFSATNQAAFFGSITLNGGTIRQLSGSGAVNTATFTHTSGTLDDGVYNVSQLYTLAGGVITDTARIGIGSGVRFDISGGNFSSGFLVNSGTVTFNFGGASSGATIDNTGTVIFAGEGGGFGIDNHATVIMNANASVGGLRNFSVPFTVPLGRTLSFFSLRQEGSSFTQFGDVNVSSLSTSTIELNSGIYDHRSGNLTGLTGLRITSGTFLADGGSQSGGTIALFNGTFLHSTGPVTMTGSLNINAFTAGASSLYRMTTGTVSASAMVLSSVNAATASFIQNAGDVQIGTLAINQGTTGFSTLAQSGGKFQVTSSSVPASNNGLISQSGGVSRFYRIDGTGSINLSGNGSMNVTGLRQGTVNLSGNGKLLVSNTPTPQTMILKSLIFDETGGSVHGAFDVGEVPLVIDYDAASPITGIIRYLKSGHASGNWTGAGLRSASAALEEQHRTALGFAVSSDLLGASGGTFAGVNVDATAVLLKYTYYGDSNLDGAVDIVDLYALASHYNASSQLWTSGDFNYDGVTNAVDLGLLARNWQAGVGSPLAVPLGAVLESFGLPLSVPEPGMLAAMGAALLGTRRRR